MSVSESDSISSFQSRSTSDDDDSSDLDQDPNISENKFVWDWAPITTYKAELEARNENETEVPVAVEGGNEWNNPSPTATSRLDGGFDYVMYVPPWTAPDWNGETWKTEENGQELRIPRRDVSQMLRPALRAEDNAINPTPYALRYGVHPDIPGGRSRCSPGPSDTRRVPLSSVQSTSSGNKDYINYQDVAIESQRFGGMANLLQNFSSIAHTSPLFEQAEAMKTLLGMIDEDKDYQRIVFTNFTTDERIAHLIHTLDPNIVSQCNLSGPLHPLVERDKWMTTVGIRGDEEDTPRYVYRFPGIKGEYSPQDNDELWDALQPALQLATRVLNSNHPYWTSMLSPYHRRPVRDARDPHMGAGYGPMVAIFDRLNPTPNAPMLRARATGFDAAQAVASFLEERLQLYVCSGWYGFGTRMATPHWGITQEGGGGTALQKDYEKKIEVEISAELMWPLLVPTFTTAEKSVCSFMIAAVIIHELAHAVNFAVARLLHNAAINGPHIPQLRGLSKKQLHTLEFMGARFCATTDIEPFWRNEPVRELGAALENGIWGGVTANAMASEFDTFPLHQTNALDLNVYRWPSNNTRPHRMVPVNELSNPHRPVDDLCTFFPVTETGRLFQEDFWSSLVPKYGHEVLKFGTGKPGLTNVQRDYKRLTDWARAFGSFPAEWMFKALAELGEARQGIVALYLFEKACDRLGVMTIKMRWHFESKLWKRYDRRAAKLAEVCEVKSLALRDACLENLKPDAEMTADARVVNAQRHADRLAGVAGVPPNITTLDEYKLGLVRDCLGAARDHLLKAQDLHRLTVVQIQLFEQLVVEYLKQDYHDRMVLDHYAEALRVRMVDAYMAPLTKVANDLEQRGRDLFAAGVTSAEWLNMFNEMVLRLRADVRLIDVTRSYVALEQIAMANSVPRIFTTVPSGHYLRRSKILEKMALKEILLMRPILREVAEKFLEILATTPILPAPSPKLTISKAVPVPARVSQALPAPANPSNLAFQGPRPNPLLYLGLSMPTPAGTPCKCSFSLSRTRPSRS